MNPDVLMLGLAMALSPLAVLASVLLLTAERGTAKAAAYAVGWVVAVGIVGALTVLAASQVHTTTGSSASTAAASLDVVLGVALVLWAFRRRAAARDGAPQPGWMRRLDSMSPLVALGFGLFMPPYAIAVAASNSIVQSDGNGQGVNVALAVVVFTVLASLGVIVPVAVVLVSSRSDELLGRWRAWLLEHWPAVLFWMLLVLGAYLIGKGLYTLTG